MIPGQEIAREVILIYKPEVRTWRKPGKATSGGLGLDSAIPAPTWSQARLTLSSSWCPPRFVCPVGLPLSLAPGGFLLPVLQVDSAWLALATVSSHLSAGQPGCQCQSPCHGLCSGDCPVWRGLQDKQPPPHICLHNGLQSASFHILVNFLHFLSSQL